MITIFSNKGTHMKFMFENFSFFIIIFSNKEKWDSYVNQWSFFGVKNNKSFCSYLIGCLSCFKPIVLITFNLKFFEKY